MERGQLVELHCITHVENLRSICCHGILSHNRAARLPHRSVASEEVQRRRRARRLPDGRLLHDYVNLYINGAIR